MNGPEVLINNYVHQPGIVEVRTSANSGRPGCAHFKGLMIRDIVQNIAKRGLL